MKRSELAWGSPEVEQFLSEQMQQFHTAGIPAAYTAAQESYIQLWKDAGFSHNSQSRQYALQAEHWLLPVLGVRLLELQMVDSQTGIPVPHSDITVKRFSKNNPNEGILNRNFTDRQAGILMDAIVEADDCGLQIKLSA